MRLAVAVIAGVLAAALTIVFANWPYAPAVGWDATAIVFTGWVWRAIWPLSAQGTAAHATAEDPNRATGDTLMLSASIASLAAVGLVLMYAHSGASRDRVLLVGLSLVSLAVSWLTVHTIYTLRYASLYYGQPEGGIDFNQQEPPSYQDFAYVALTLGMTFQVSDTSLQSSAMRSAVLRHALVSYLFGSIILATAINLIGRHGLR